MTPEQKKSRRWSAEDARAALERLRRSGLSTAAFAQREGLSAKRLYLWQQRLKQKQKATFIEVVAPALSEQRLEVALPCGIIVRLAEASHPEKVAELVAALERRRSC
jgi:transposase-like protein